MRSFWQKKKEWVSSAGRVMRKKSSGIGKEHCCQLGYFEHLCRDEKKGDATCQTLGYFRRVHVAVHKLYPKSTHLSSSQVYVFLRPLIAVLKSDYYYTIEPFPGGVQVLIWDTCAATWFIFLLASLSRSPPTFVGNLGIHNFHVPYYMVWYQTPEKCSM